MQVSTPIAGLHTHRCAGRAEPGTATGRLTALITVYLSDPVEPGMLRPCSRVHTGYQGRCAPEVTGGSWRRVRVGRAAARCPDPRRRARARARRARLPPGTAGPAAPAPGAPADRAAARAGHGDAAARQHRGRLPGGRGHAVGGHVQPGPEPRAPWPPLGDTDRRDPDLGDQERTELQLG